MLEISNLYDLYNKVKKNQSFSADIKELVKITEAYRDKEFSKLDDDKKSQIRKLNRNLLRKCCNYSAKIF